MRSLLMLGMTVALVVGAAVTAEDKKPPEKLVFRSKAGDVTFLHAAHLKREKGECTACHDKLWPQSSKTPLRAAQAAAPATIRTANRSRLRATAPGATRRPPAPPKLDDCLALLNNVNG